MLFHSSIRRELAHSFGATLLVLLVIVVTMLLISTLGLAQKGRVNPQEILLVLTYTVVGRLPIVLTIALFVAVASTLTRMHRDSEMAVWFTSGRGLADFLKPVFHFAWPVLLVIALLVLLVWPWANQQAEQLRDRFQQRGELERVQAGQFVESADGRSVFFIERDPADPAAGRNVFISRTEPDGSQSIVSAASGRIEWQQGQQWLRIDNGQRLLFNRSLAPGEVQLSEFTSYRVLIDAQPVVLGAAQGLKSRPTWTLIAEPTAANQGELAWRLGLALAAFNFVLMALAVASSNPRANKSGNILFLLFGFIFYYNLMTMGQRWIGTGAVDALPFMLALHGSALALCVLWLAKRHWGWELRLVQRFNRRPAAGTSGVAAA